MRSNSSPVTHEENRPACSTPQRHAENRANDHVGPVRHPNAASAVVGRVASTFVPFDLFLPFPKFLLQNLLNTLFVSRYIRAARFAQRAQGRWGLDRCALNKGLREVLIV